MMWKILPFFVALFVVGLGSSPPAGLRDISPQDVDFESALKYAISEYNINSKEENIYAKVDVIKAQIQIEEERVKYIITTKLGKTFCTKEYRHIEFCPVIKHPPFAKFLICVFKVLKHHGMKLLHSECKKISVDPWD